MLTREHVLEAIKTKQWIAGAFDGRDISRLTAWFPQSDWCALFGAEEHTHKPRQHPEKSWTTESILAQLAEDVEFGFEKALDKRGISAGCMFEVVRMWLWILEDPMPTDESVYAQYGLPLLKAVAVKYGFPNPIGADKGTEHTYSMRGGKDDDS